MQDRIKEFVVALLLYFLDIYRRHICIVPCHRERIVPKTCQTPGDSSLRYCTRRLPLSYVNVRQKRGYAALSPDIRVDCREHLIEPTDNLRSEQHVRVVAGNA